jgi:quinol monooxygenase YgiN
LKPFTSPRERKIQNTFVFCEIYKSHAAQEFHLQHEFTKKFLAMLKTAQAADRVRTNLVELLVR